MFESEIFEGWIIDLCFMRRILLLMIKGKKNDIFDGFCILGLDNLEDRGEFLLGDSLIYFFFYLGMGK